MSTVLPEPRASILVVESDPVALEVLSSILEGMGHLVFSSQTGQMAVDILEHVWCDVLVTSLILGSGMNGMSLAISAKEINRHIDVIVSKGHQFGGATLSFVDGYIRKPFVDDEIHSTITAAVKRTTARRASPTKL